MSQNNYFKLNIFIFVILIVSTNCSDEKITKPNYNNPYDYHNWKLVTGTVTDIDGNVYKTVKIGDQVWMAENLKVTHYRNGEPIPNVTVVNEWEYLTTGAQCSFDNNEANVAIYGRLYNWYAVNDSRGLAPAGWHVPSDAEWKQLEMHLGMSQSQADSIKGRGTNEGDKLKENGTVHWESSNYHAPGEYGFTALPGGYRSNIGTFYMTAYVVGYIATFWSSTEYNSFHAWYRSLGTSPSIFRDNCDKQWGYSVRCVRDH